MLRRATLLMPGHEMFDQADHTHQCRDCGAEIPARALTVTGRAAATDAPRCTMPERVEPQTGRTHGIAERIHDGTLPEYFGDQKVRTTCGRIVWGRTGYSAYLQFITCRSCQRILKNS